MMSTSNTLGFAHFDDYPRAREVLLRANYTPEGMGETLGSTGALTAQSADAPVWLRRTSGNEPLHTLIRLFLLNVAVEPDKAHHALAPMALESWLEAGLLAMENDQVVPRIQLQSYHGLILASDMPKAIHTGTRPDHVMGVAKSSMLLLNNTLRRPARRVLDVGTGCGIQALLCCAHSKQVFATDRNPRAELFTHFNAALNGLTNLQGLTGNLFEPVSGQRFDLIVCNAPYVISPHARFMFCDSGMRGDEFCRLIIQQAAQFLEDGGYAQLVCNWTHGASQDWQEGLAHWFDGTGCDVLVLGGSTESASNYASNWIRDTDPNSSEQHFTAAYNEWMDYYAREGIETISHGVITMRRTDGMINWIRLDDAPPQMTGPTGEAIIRSFQAQDFLENTKDDQQLLQERFRYSPHVRFEQLLEPTADGWSAAASRLRLLQGLAYVNDVNAHVANLVVRCTGEHPLQVLLLELASAIGADAQQFVPQAVPVVRHLIRQGFLLPSSIALPESTTT
ncbi:MAG: class I SAM-dependent methyltransferase [Candidatus Competibacteraceae bacterium]|jgi:methylase of polypeptide subunit release factors|nr:class I SAM-dependent methyltransferase [Candidatus Competibacteraceae bacterium]